jgi:tryptophan-rich sensory protein
LPSGDHAAITLFASTFGAVTQGDDVGERYLALELPAWAPPQDVFGIVWPVLYVLIAAAAWRVWRVAHGAAPARTELSLWLAQLVVNAAWPGVFFGLEAFGPAVAVIVVLDLLVVATMVALAWRSTGGRPAAGALPAVDPLRDGAQRRGVAAQLTSGVVPVGAVPVGPLRGGVGHLRSTTGFSSAPMPSISTRPLAGQDRPDAGRGPGQDHVARQQGHDLRDLAEQLRGDVPHQVGGGAVLADLAVDEAADPQVAGRGRWRSPGRAGRTSRTPWRGTTGSRAAAGRGR